MEKNENIKEEKGCIGRLLDKAKNGDISISPSFKFTDKFKSIKEFMLKFTIRF